jgi:molybdate transport system substrate-binding protein
MSRQRVAFLVVAFLVCGTFQSLRLEPSVIASAAESRTVLTLVAASTKEAVDDAATIFTADTGIVINISPAGSNILANQIINGADADVFLSANQEWADAVAKKGFAVQTRPLLTNDLVLAVPRGNAANVKSPVDLLADRVAHVALAGERVPAGIYARQALQSLKVYGGLVRDKKIIRGDDVRSTLAFIERGEVAAGVVYSTDAQLFKRVEVVYTFDPKTYDKIVYPLVLLKHGQDNPAARKWFDFLSSKAAQAVFEKRGFKLLK